MKLRVVCAEKSKQKFLLDGEAEYLRRFPREFSVEITEHGSKKDLLKDLAESRARRAFVGLLDETGKQFSSTQFAELLSKRMVDGTSTFIFAIGPAEGWSEEDRTAGDFAMSLSPLTFTYQMSRLVLVEQLYRVISIQKGTPYHK